MNEITPTNITANRKERVLTISWSNGEESTIPFHLLRNACPCAQCRGGHENMRSTPDPDVFLIPITDARSAEMINLQAVGNYAITVTWGDGHQYGIYTWDYLRALGKGAGSSDSDL